MLWLSKYCVKKWEKVFTKVGLGCEAERRCVDGLCCFFFLKSAFTSTCV